MPTIVHPNEIFGALVAPDSRWRPTIECPMVKAVPPAPKTLIFGGVITNA
jgi:hypothetical protein